MTAVDLSLYRPNVGVVLLAADGRVWLGRRADVPGPRNWQFPQGGVDPGETLETAAARELREETGARSASLIGRTSEWIAYDFPPHARRARGKQGWIGQKQMWVAFRFTGDDSEFDLAGHHQIEFDAWRWAAIDEALDLVAPFKLATYRAVVEAFRPLTAN
ncbi:MAG: RNA pyrophosphohydrolase [Caulobacteraceae bacterium]